MSKSQEWLKEHTVVFSVRVNNDSGLADRIKQAAKESDISVAQFFIQGALAKLNSMTTSDDSMTIDSMTTSDDSMTTRNDNSHTTKQADPTPAVPTYTPTDPLDIVAEAFFHKPYAVLTLDSKNMCDFIADHPITGPDMVLSFPDEWIKAGIEYMNNPTPVPVYQPKPIENAEPISENLKRIRAYRAAKDEAFRQSLAELESLYPEDSDDMFYADSDENVPEEISDYSEENSEEL